MPYWIKASFGFLGGLVFLILYKISPEIFAVATGAFIVRTMIEVLDKEA